MWYSITEKNEGPNQIKDEINYDEMNYGGDLVSSNIFLETSLTIPLPLIVSEKIESYEFHDIKELNSEFSYSLDLSEIVHRSEHYYYYYILFEVPFSRSLDKTISINSIPLKINDSNLISYDPSMLKINPPTEKGGSVAFIKDAPIVIHNLESDFNISLEVKEPIEYTTLSFSNPKLQIEYLNGKEYQGEKISLSKGKHNINLSLKSELSEIELYHSNIILSYFVGDNEQKNVMHWHTSIFDTNKESFLAPILDNEQE